MALALNNYRVGYCYTINNGVYTAPTGYSAIILLAQATNIGGSTQTIDFLIEELFLELQILQRC